MSWGEGGQEIRERLQLELSLVRMHAYRARKLAETLPHTEKGPQLRKLFEELEVQLTEIERQLSR